MPSRRLIKDELRYKTVLCDKYTATGSCPYKHKCQFAHGIEELRKRVVTPEAAMSFEKAWSPPLPPGPPPNILQVAPPMDMCSEANQGIPDKFASVPAVMALSPPPPPLAAPASSKPLQTTVPPFGAQNLIPRVPQSLQQPSLLSSPFNVFSAKPDDTIPLRCNDKTGKVEAQRASTEILHAVMEPQLRRDLSHHTAMLRRTLSLILDDASEDISASLTEAPPLWLASSTYAYRPAVSAA